MKVGAGAASGRWGRPVIAGNGEPGAGADRPGVPAGADGVRPHRRRWRMAAGVVVVAAVAGTVTGVLYSSRGNGGVGSRGGAPLVLGTVTRGTLTSQTAVGATLGYAGSPTA